jgi:hypothetical protein
MRAGENTSHEQLAADIAALQTFANEYRAYLDLRSRFAAGDDNSQALLEQSRTRIWQLLPTARRGMEHSGVRLTITPPPMLGGPMLTDFESQVFAHEHAPYLPGPFSAGEVPATARMVLDRVAAAIGELSDQLQQGAISAGSVDKEPRQHESQGGTYRRRAPMFGRLKRLPAPLAILADVITIGLFVAAIITLGRGGGRSGAHSPKQQRSSSHTTSISPPTTSRSTAQPPPPELNADATCATVRDASGGQVHRAIFVDSPGQLEAGGRAMLGKVLPHGQYTELLRVTEGAELEFSVKLRDTEYGAVQGAVLSSVTTPGGHGCWTVTTRVHSQTEGPGHLTLGRVFVLLQSNNAGSMRYVPGSTELFDVEGNVIAGLRDGVTQQGVSIPYEIKPAPAGLYYVNWKMRVR